VALPVVPIQEMTPLIARAKTLSEDESKAIEEEVEKEVEIERKQIEDDIAKEHGPSFEIKDLAKLVQAADTCPVAKQQALHTLQSLMQISVPSAAPVVSTPANAGSVAQAHLTLDVKTEHQL